MWNEVLEVSFMTSLLMMSAAATHKELRWRLTDCGELKKKEDLHSKLSKLLWEWKILKYEKI